MTPESDTTQHEVLIPDATLIKALAEFAVDDPLIQEELKIVGFTQFSYAYPENEIATIPLNLATPSDVPNHDTQEPHPKYSTQAQKDNLQYYKTIAYLTSKVADAIPLVKSSTLGINEVFQKKLSGGTVDPQAIIDIMESHGINVTSHPNNKTGQNGVTYSEKDHNWSAVFIKHELNDQTGTLVFSEFAKVVVLEQLSTLPTQPQQGMTNFEKLVSLLAKNSINKQPNSDILMQSKLNWYLLDNFWEVVRTQTPNTNLAKNFARLFQPESNYESGT